MAETFEDEALKSIVQRFWGTERCPKALRGRVIAQVGIGARPIRAREWPGRISARLERVIGGRYAWPGLALASLGIALGLCLRAAAPAELVHRPSAASATPLPTAPCVCVGRPSIPVPLQVALVQTHDRCCRSVDHHRLDVAGRVDASLADVIRSRLSRPVLVARPAGPEWTFRGAAICAVGGTPCGHLVFARDGAMVSVFSLPRSAASDVTDGAPVRVVIDRHPICAFSKDGGLFCLVASGPTASISATDLDQMRRELTPAITAGPTIGVPVPTDDELLKTCGPSQHR